MRPRPVHTAVLSALLLSCPLYAADPTWSKLYDSSTPLPGTNQTPFFLSGVAVSGSNFAFAARYTDEWGDYEGVYASINGTLQRVVDLSTTLPGSNGALMDYSIYDPSLDGDEVAFNAVGARHNLPEGEYPWNAGIYRYRNGTLSAVADEQMTAPGTAIHFYDFSQPDIQNGTVIFQGIDEDGLASGVYTQAPAGGPLNVIADLSTPVPNHPGVTFQAFPYRFAHTTFAPDGSAVFLGMISENTTANTSEWGIYRTAGPGGPIQTVVEEQVTPVPHGTGPFEEIYSPVAADDGTLVFFGFEYSGYLENGLRGIYAVDPATGALSRLVDTTTPLPDSSGNTFESFGQPFDDVAFAYHDGYLLFEGYDFVTKLNNDLHGLYLRTPAGNVQTLLTPGQSFDGKTIEYWLLNRDSLTDSGITLSLHFTDGSAGIYSTDAFATLPPALPGDTNDDGVVDLTDLNNVLNNFGTTPTTHGLPGDTNQDQFVDLVDLNNVLNNFGRFASYPTATSSLTLVPEPTALFGVCGLALFPLRRRSRR